MPSSSSKVPSVPSEEVCHAFVDGPTVDLEPINRSALRIGPLRTRCQLEWAISPATVSTRKIVVGAPDRLKHWADYPPQKDRGFARGGLVDVDREL